MKLSANRLIILKHLADGGALYAEAGRSYVVVSAKASFSVAAADAVAIIESDFVKGVEDRLPARYVFDDDERTELIGAVVDWLIPENFEEFTRSQLTAYVFDNLFRFTHGRYDAGDTGRDDICETAKDALAELHGVDEM